MKKLYTFLNGFLLFAFLSYPIYANDCLQYKLSPSVSVVAPEWTREIVQPYTEMSLLHGTVVATLNENYEIFADAQNVKDGFCVYLKSVNATVGYSDFLVKIDKRHTAGSCPYNATLEHETEHINTYLSVIDNYNDYIKESVKSAADSIMPIFVQGADNMDAAINKLNDELQSHPDLILMKQKIKAEEEIRNKGVDDRDPGTRIKKCMDKGNG